MIVYKSDNFNADKYIEIIRNNHFQTTRNDNIFHIINQGKGYGTVVIETLPILHGGSLEITLTVPLTLMDF